MLPNQVVQRMETTQILSERRLAVLELLLQMLMEVMDQHRQPHKQVMFQVTHLAVILVVHPHLLEMLKLRAMQVLIRSHRHDSNRGSSKWISFSRFFYGLN